MALYILWGHRTSTEGPNNTSLWQPSHYHPIPGSTVPSSNQAYSMEISPCLWWPCYKRRSNHTICSNWRHGCWYSNKDISLGTTLEICLCHGTIAMYAWVWVSKYLPSDLPEFPRMYLHSKVSEGYSHAFKVSRKFLHFWGFWKFPCFQTWKLFSFFQRLLI